MCFLEPDLSGGDSVESLLGISALIRPVSDPGWCKKKLACKIDGHPMYYSLPTAPNEDRMAPAASVARTATQPGRVRSMARLATCCGGATSFDFSFLRNGLALAGSKWQYDADVQLTRALAALRGALLHSTLPLFTSLMPCRSDDATLSNTCYPTPRLATQCYASP